MINGAINKNIRANEKLSQSIAKLVIDATATLITPEAELVQEQYQELCKSIVCQNELLLAIVS